MAVGGGVLDLTEWNDIVVYAALFRAATLYADDSEQTYIFGSR